MTGGGGGGGGGGSMQPIIHATMCGNQTSFNRHPNLILLVTCDQLVHKLNSLIDISCG